MYSALKFYGKNIMRDAVGARRSIFFVMMVKSSEGSARTLIRTISI